MASAYAVSSRPRCVYFWYDCADNAPQRALLGSTNMRNPSSFVTPWSGPDPRGSNGVTIDESATPGTRHGKNSGVAARSPLLERFQAGEPYALAFGGQGAHWLEG